MSELGWKEPVLLATTANITLSGEQSIDGTTTTEDRVLVKNQTDTTENGIYVSSSSAWTRATDCDGPGDITNGSAVLVHSGSINAGTIWRATVSADPPTIGTSTITWSQFSPTATLDADLTAIAAETGTGFLRRDGDGDWSVGTLILNAELADMSQSTIKGRAAGAGTGDATDLTATQATAILDAMVGDSGSGGTKGLVPAPASGDSGKVLSGAGTWIAAGGDMLAANNGSDFADTATAFANIKVAATETATGVVELATTAEAVAGTDTERAVTPAGVEAAVNARTEAFIIAVSDETTAVTAGASKVKWRAPYALTITAVRASLSTAQSSGSILTIDINDGGSTILSTKLTIDNGEKTSTTAAAAAVISDTAIADDAEISVDVDSLGDGTATGMKVYLICTRS